MNGKKFLSVTCFSVGIFTASSFAAHAQQDDELDALMQMPLKQLMEIEVTSVSKRAEKANETAAAISVITAEDIRRSGHNTVPEVLRGIPGVQVSRLNSGWWAITARGNANQFGNKLLVLLDGRSIYNPLFSGVVWEEQGTPLEDIERIEVIRGPGSTLWGSNAVNGVINIITKHSKDTQGDMIAGGAGTYDNASGYMRHGGKIGENSTYRAYVNHYRQDNSETASNVKAHDAWNISRAGIRTDGKIDDDSTFNITSDVYHGEREIPFVLAPRVNAAGFAQDLDNHHMYGGNIIGKYSRKLDNESNLDLQVYYDFVGRNADEFGQDIHTLDFDAQQTFDNIKGHQLIWGGGYRIIYAEMDPSLLVRYPFGDTETTHTLSSFIQDKIELTPELFLTLGSKFEYNSYTNFEFQPNARLAWLPTEDQTVWGAVTKAVRTPSIIERTMTQIAGGLPASGGLVAINANQHLDSEEVIAYELGYRNQPLDTLSLDTTIFLNKYNDLRTIEPGGATGGDVAVGLRTANLGERVTTGFELAANWEVSNQWQLSGSYSYLDMDFKRGSGSSDTSALAEDGKSPSNMYSIRSHYMFNEDWEIDTAIYYTDEISGNSTNNTKNIGAYTRADLKLTWRPMEGVETAIIGQNLLDDQHQEFGASYYSVPYEIPRSVYGKVTVRF